MEETSGSHPRRDAGAVAGAAWQLAVVSLVVLTLGASGCLVADGSGRTAVAAFPAEAVDTVGAGDAFNAALAVALADGMPLPEAARRACAAASIAVTRPGAQGALPTRAKIDRVLTTAWT